MRKTLGRLVFWSLVLYLLIKGAIILRPHQAMVALWALTAALVRACTE